MRAVTAVAAAVVAMAAAVAAPAGATNDAEWGRQWGPQRIGVERAFGAGVTGKGVRIGIVDTGVDLGHPDLAGAIVSNAACIGTGGDQGACTDGDGNDVDGPGTHVAGIAAATKDNGVGISGVAPGARLVVARVFEQSASGGAYITDVTAGIKYVVDHGAKVVNLSLGDSLPLRGELFATSSLDDGIAYAWNNGAVAVLAAGNANYFGLGSANYGDVNAVVVGAVGRSDEPAGYSSPTGNAKWAVVAPGGNSSKGGEAAEIYSTLPSNGYGYMEGTSMAAPHVTGALALLMSQGKSNAEAVSRLLSTADRSVSCGPNSPNCRGLVDVGCAVVAQCGNAVSTPTTTNAGASTAPGAVGSSPSPSGGASGTTSSPSAGAPSGGSGSPASTAPPGGSAAPLPRTGDVPGGGAGDAGAAQLGGGTQEASTLTGTGGHASPARSRSPGHSWVPSAAASSTPGDTVPPGTPDGPASVARGMESELTLAGGAAPAGTSSPRLHGGRRGPSLVVTGSAAGLLALVAGSGLTQRRRYARGRRSLGGAAPGGT